ncbi:MAG: hypothetical protein COS42_06170 [Flavobacteriales bacterium CG03_land_8_20_14_0_80_35_15]|nr:MAG: hypothetical protein COV50_06695 [Flavobacteriales bacterium CG11_big_fil_rev_8_21_14_0_20_35_7]PIV17169.1 MAG: hypothetical protein COS42_06170 [Flavobacteriales bacterium CG03_land_8_20_14_0_80_35_15]PIX07282.1 MAG: hypothetical protein COZ76_04375 [Flavobacteriales bacterium CG_4_8_14_3_um_filter_35_10]PJA05241.1 MAG: hypothetical protein COX71_07760 [Flavobacteriales bacterium CG_4_10_14_0_2_um_filter_35_18]
MIKISINEKVNPSAPSEPRKFYGIVKSSGTVDIRQLAKQVSKETSLGTPDVVAVIEALLQDIPDYLLDGKIVNLGDFGSFRLTASGKGAATLGEYSTSMIEKTNLNFRAGKVFKDFLSRATYQKEV